MAWVHAERSRGLAADDGVGLRFAGTELAEIVSAREDACAYRVDPNGSGVDEKALEPRPIRLKIPDLQAHLADSAVIR